MIQVFSHGAPNPRKITIMLEELGWEYEFKHVDLNRGEHKQPEY